MCVIMLLCEQIHIRTYDVIYVRVHICMHMHVYVWDTKQRVRHLFLIDITSVKDFRSS